MQDVIQTILKETQVELTKQFKLNFTRRKAFFSGAPWAPTKKPVNIGSLMYRSGDLSNSLTSEIRGTQIVFTSERPDAKIHNEGGSINRTSSKGKNYQIKMPKRQFIGGAPEVDDIIGGIIDHNIVNTINEELNRMWNNG